MNKRRKQSRDTIVKPDRDLDRQMVKDGTSKTVQTARSETLAKDSSDRQTVKAGR